MWFVCTPSCPAQSASCKLTLAPCKNRSLLYLSHLMWCSNRAEPDQRRTWCILAVAGERPLRRARLTFCTEKTVGLEKRPRKPSMFNLNNHHRGIVLWWHSSLISRVNFEIVYGWQEKQSVCCCWKIIKMIEQLPRSCCNLVLDDRRLSLLPIDEGSHWFGGHHLVVDTLRSVCITWGVIFVFFFLRGYKIKIITKVGKIKKRKRNFLTIKSGGITEKVLTPLHKSKITLCVLYLS